MLERQTITPPNNHKWMVLSNTTFGTPGGVTAALAIIVFIGAWNAFLWPFLVVTKEPLMNTTVAIGQVEQ